MAKFSRMQKRLLWRIKNGIDPLDTDRKTLNKLNARKHSLQSLIQKGTINQEFEITDAGEEDWKKLVAGNVDQYGYVDNNRPGWVQKVLSGKNKKKKHPEQPGAGNKNVQRDPGMEPDWSQKCECCGQSPVVPLTGMCGPCSGFGGDTAGGDW